jgi:DNA-binding CsgD family transcriptional regulator
VTAPTTVAEAEDLIRRHIAAIAVVRSHLLDLQAADLARVDQAITAATGGNAADLSFREVEVLRLLAGTDMTNIEIGRRLYVTENTVKTHVKSIYRKLGVARRRELQKRFAARPAEDPRQASRTVASR